MKSRANFLDQIIAYFSPRAGADRLRARIVSGHLSGLGSRKYEGASYARRNEGWTTHGSSANSETKFGLSQLRARARDLVRNDPHAFKAMRTIANNTVGTGIVPRPQSSSGRNRDVKRLWQLWGSTPACDYDDRNSFYGLQYQIMKAVAETGECLVRRRRMPGTNLPLPLQLQVLEGDYLASFKEGPEKDNYVIQGIEFNKQGKRVAYWVYNQHPGGMFTSQVLTILPERIPADQILHIYLADRPGQVRGITWLSPAIVKLKDHSDFSDATLLRQKIAACFTAFVTESEQVDIDAQKVYELGEKLEPGAIELLSPGKNVAFANPPQAEGFDSFSRPQLRAVAAGMGITYEALTGDYSQVNFSSARMAWLEFQRTIEVWRWHMLIPQLCSGVWNWFAEAAAVSGALDGKPIPVEWTAPRREMIDPVSETKATIMGIRGGLKSLSEAIRENGDEPEDVLNDIESDNKMIDEKKLVLDSDPRKVMQSGGLQSNSQPQDKGGAIGPDENQND